MSDQHHLDLFRLYLDEVGRHPLLTKEDEIELSQAYEAGLDAQLKLADTSPDDPARPDLEAICERGEWARRKMIESNLRVDEQVGRLRRTQTRMHELLGRETGRPRWSRQPVSGSRGR